MSCAELLKFGEGIVGPSAGGLTTFSQTFAFGSELDQVGLAAIVACFYDTANLRLGAATLEFDWVPYGLAVVVAPAAITQHVLPVFGPNAVTGRVIVAFPTPLAVPPSPDGSGRRCQGRILLTAISAGTATWRVFVQTAVRRNGEWVT